MPTQILRLEKNAEGLFVAFDADTNLQIAEADAPRQLMMQLAATKNQTLYRKNKKWRRIADDKVNTLRPKAAAPAEETQAESAVNEEVPVTA